MSGLDIDRIVGLDAKYSKTLECAICLQILNDPIVTTCGHTYCHQCIKDVIESGAKECPKCRKPFRNECFFSSEDLYTVVIRKDCVKYFFTKNLTVKEVITKLQIRCDFELNGCEELVEIGLLSKHIEECKHRLCKTCGFTAGQTQDHNCVELLKNEIKNLKEKYEKCFKTNEEMKKDIEMNSKDKKALNSKFELINNEMKNWKEMYGKCLKTVEDMKSDYQLLLDYHWKAMEEKSFEEKRYEWYYRYVCQRMKNQKRESKTNSINLHLKRKRI